MKKIVMLLCILGLAMPMFALNAPKRTIEFGKYKCEFSWTESQFWANDVYDCGENAQLMIRYYPLGVFDKETEAQYLNPQEYFEEKVEYLKESYDEVKEEYLENGSKIVYAYNDVVRRFLLLDGEKILDFSVYNENYNPQNEKEDVEAIQKAKVPAEPVYGF